MAKIKDFTKNNKKLSFLFTFLLVTAVAGETKPDETKPAFSPSSNAILKSSCSSTPSPEFCVNAVASGGVQNLTSQKDVIGALLVVTSNSVKKSSAAVKGLLLTGIGLSPRAKTAANDCLETLDGTLDDIQFAAQELLLYPNVNGTRRKHTGNLKTMISSAITNQETCLEGFSNDAADMVIRDLIYQGEVYIQRLCGVALALIKNLTATDVANSKPESQSSNNRKLNEAAAAADGVRKWPRWLSAKDRRLLQSESVEPDLVVAQDGSGDFTTVGEAVEAAPKKSEERFVIKINAGIYSEIVNVPKNKMNIMFIGDGQTETIITGDRSVGGNTDMTTFRSATVAVVGDGFMARDITFENTAGPSNNQAVALRVGSDKSAFYRCNISAYQDTLYVHSKRQYFVECHVSGTVDFIFGNAAIVFQDSDIDARRPNPNQKNMVTAQGRTDPNQNTGIVIQNCRIGATSDLLEVEGHDFPTYLGRPWKMYSRTVVMRSDISDVIRPEGWHVWNGDFALDTLTYREYQNTGPGAVTENRVTWKGFKVITDPSEAEEYTADRFIDGADWLSETGFPFELGF